MTSNTTTRKSNLELLRIIGILLIVMMHFCGQGGFSAAHNPAVAFLGSAGRLSVNIFLLIGCWFMVDAPFRPERIVRQPLSTQALGIPAVAILVFVGATLIDAFRIWLEPHYLDLPPVRWLVRRLGPKN